MFSIEALRNSSFSWRTSLSLAVASSVSYEAEAVVKNIGVNNWGFSRVVFFDVDETQGFIASVDDVVLVAFRGTESLGDWLSNLDLASRQWPGHGELHNGFLACYERVKNLVLAEVSKGGRAKKLWLTGHSLGGALATIAAADLTSAHVVAGVHTFGQPRLGDQSFQRFIEQHLPNKFFRFVNDDDIVPRIPPGFEHVGKLIHFDAQGRVQKAEPGVEAAEIETPPLTEIEFRQMQAEMKLVKATLDTHGAVGTEAFDASVEGLFPSISDHRIANYIAAIRRQTLGATIDSTLERADAESVFANLSVELATPSVLESFEAAPEAMKSISRGPSSARKAPQKPSSELFPVLIRLRDENWSAPETVDIHSRIGAFASAQTSLEGLAQLENDPLVISIEASREAGKPELAASVPFVGGDVVHRPPIEEKGDAAIVGVVDAGVDVLHEAFRDAAGKSRIIAYWDQRGSGGPTPKALPGGLFTQDYGVVYTAANIDNFISGALAPPTALHGDAGLGHGTHVASIAAGRAVGTLPDGMAPEAKIIVVAPHMKTGPGDPPSLGYSNSHVDALQFLKLVVKGGNVLLSDPLPIAVNISLGMNAGAHDGSSTLEAVFDAVTQSGRDPGYVIVKSAGNERGHGGHARVRAFTGVESIGWNSSDVFRNQDYFELWHSSLDKMTFTLVDPAGNRSAEVSSATPEVKQTLGGNVCQLRLTEIHPDNGASRLSVTIMMGANPIQAGVWSLKITGTAIGSGEANVDMWVERNDDRPLRFVIEDPRLTLSIPGTANTVITVGACNSALPLELLPASSYGGTWDGRPKPDICAPGTAIVAAGANEASHQAVTKMSGTSMAAPHVSGALALVMSHRHKQVGAAQYNARQFQAALVRTAKQFNRVHHEGYGFGALDAENLFNALK